MTQAGSASERRSLRWRFRAGARAAALAAGAGLEDGKGYLGPARSWTSWHHHLGLVALAPRYVTLYMIRRMVSGR